MRHQGEFIYTFWDYFRNAYGRNPGLRIDHMLLSPPIAYRLSPIAYRLTAAEADYHVRVWEKTSEHAPVWIEISDRSRRQRTKAPARP